MRREKAGMSFSNRRTRGLHGAACTAAVIAAFGLTLPAATPALADPPYWAPAHGERARHERRDDYERGFRHEREHEHEREDERRRRDDMGWRDADRIPRYLSLPASGVGVCNRELLGTVIGSVAGGAMGSQIGRGEGRTAAIIAGAVIGGIVGGSVGQSMDNVDTQCLGQALEHAQNGRSVVWHDPDDNTSYSVTPTRTWQTAQGRYCREYTAMATIDGHQQETYGTACRQPDGSWKIVN